MRPPLRDAGCGHEHGYKPDDHRESRHGRKLDSAGVGAGPEPFDRDVALNEGYRYTTNAPLSSRLANDRLTDATLDLVPLAGRSLIDVGCGDGTYTADLAREDLGLIRHLVHFFTARTA